MELELYIKGSLATLPGDRFPEPVFLAELARRGLSAQDSRLALEKAVLEGFVQRLGDGTLVKLARADTEAKPGNLSTT
jgi:hypothetical protein